MYGHKTVKKPTSKMHKLMHGREMQLRSTKASLGRAKYKFNEKTLLKSVRTVFVSELPLTKLSNVTVFCNNYHGFMKIGLLPALFPIAEELYSYF